MSKEISTGSAMAVAGLCVAGGVLVEYAPKAFRWFSENITLEDLARVAVRLRGPDEFDEWALSQMPDVNTLPESFTTILKLTDDERERLSRKLIDRQKQLNSLPLLRLPSALTLSEGLTKRLALASSGYTKKGYTKKKSGVKRKGMAALASGVVAVERRKRHVGRASPNKATQKRLDHYDGFREEEHTKEKAIELTVRREARNGSVVGVKNIRRAVELAVRKYRPND